MNRKQVEKKLMKIGAPAELIAKAVELVGKNENLSDGNGNVVIVRSNDNEFYMFEQGEWGFERAAVEKGFVDYEVKYND
jgi:hypothetical protein